MYSVLVGPGTTTLERDIDASNLVMVERNSHTKKRSIGVGGYKHYVIYIGIRCRRRH